MGDRSFLFPTAAVLSRTLRAPAGCPARLATSLRTRDVIFADRAPHLRPAAAEAAAPPVPRRVAPPRPTGRVPRPRRRAAPHRLAVALLTAPVEAAAAVAAASQ